MKIRIQNKLRSGLLTSLLILGIFVTLQLSPVHGQSFTGSQTVPMGTTLSSDSRLSYVDNGPGNGTVLKRDSLIKYLETGSDTHWDPGEPVVYDLNNDSSWESIEPVIAGTLAIGSHLNVDPLIKYVDISNSSRWQSGDAVVYDTNNNNQYVIGKPVIAGTPVPVGSTLTTDTKHVKFIGSGSTWATGNTVVYASNGGGNYSASSDPHLTYVKAGTNTTWVPGESVVYDVNLTSTFANGDPVLYGAKPSVGTSLFFDLKILFVDSNRNAVWDSGEAIVYDSNANSMYDSTDTVIVAASPPIGVGLSTDPKLRYVQSGSNSTWVPGETLVYDSIGNGNYSATLDPKITFWDINGTGLGFRAGDPVIYDQFGYGYYKSPDPIIQTYGHNNIPTVCATAGDCPLTIDHHFHFVDTGLTGHWATGDTVIYDPDSDHVYLTGDLVVAGTAPANGTPLTEPVIQGKAPPVGTPLANDLKVKFLQLNGNSVWQPGEAVVYDSNNDTIYDLAPSPPDIVIVGTVPVLGTLLSEPVIAGPIPKVGTALKMDSSIKFIDAARTWSPGDTVVYHSGTGGYTRSDTVVADGAPGRGVWQSGQVVTYDSNLDAHFETGEPVVYGTAPLNGTSLSFDPKIKYIDAGSNNQWISGDTVVYDVVGNGVYSQGDLIIVGTAPSPAIFLEPAASMDNQGRVWLAWDEKPPGSSAHTTVYFKTGNGTVWSAKQAVSSGSFNDTGSFVTPLVNSTMMVLWSSNRGSTASIFYRLYSAIGTAPFAGAGPVQLTSSSMYDHSPSAVQDRNGRLWVTWSRATVTGSSQIYYKYFNGSAWSADFILPPAIVSGTPEATSPYVTQVKDGRIAIVWADNATSNSELYLATANDTSPLLSTTIQPVWSSAVPLPLGNSGDEDDHPSLLQSQNGNFWLFFQRSVLSPSAEDLMGFNSTILTNPGSWSNVSIQTSGNDQAPTAIENSDHLIWVFYNTVNLSTGLQIVYEKSLSQALGYDLGVRQLSAPSFIRAVYPINVTSVVENYGYRPATGTLTLYDNGSFLYSWSVSLNPGQIKSFYYSWNVSAPPYSNAAYGRYTISSALTNISLPGNSPNNLDTSVSYFMEVSPPGDVDGNGTVNIVDLAYVAFCWGQIAGSSPTCNQYVDTDRSGQPIGIQDLALAAFYFNKSV